MPLVTFQVVIIVCSVILVLFAAFITYRVFQLPKSLYSTGLRIATLLVFCVVFLRLPSGILPEFRGGTVVYALGSLFLTLHTVIFVLSELEFLKILSPFVGGRISPIIVTRIQIVTAFVGLTTTAASFIDYMPASIRIWFIRDAYIFTGCVQIYDISQQCYLLYYVLYKLKGATTLFRAQYAGVILLGVTFVILGAVVGVLFQRYSLCSAACMELLRQALLKPTVRRVSSPGKRPSISKPAGKLVRASTTTAGKALKWPVSFTSSVNKKDGQPPRSNMGVLSTRPAEALTPSAVSVQDSVSPPTSSSISST
ncbi:hypothetical protein BC831DRAFT_444296 [Entophlyctis helioformis]|nr:hypothetical protein BC831DRAFT_444296 [Entophlyctis helioformis]